MLISLFGSPDVSCDDVQKFINLDINTLSERETRRELESTLSDYFYAWEFRHDDKGTTLIFTPDVVMMRRENDPTPRFYEMPFRSTDEIQLAKYILGWFQKLLKPEINRGKIKEYIQEHIRHGKFKEAKNA